MLDLPRRCCRGLIEALVTTRWEEIATTQNIDHANIARHTLACLRSLDRKLGLVPDLVLRQDERLAGVERSAIALRREVVDLREDIALLESKRTVGRRGMLAMLQRSGQEADRR